MIDRKRAEAAIVALLVEDLDLLDPDVREYLIESGALVDGEVRPVRAAVSLVLAGVPPEKAAALVDWRGFESLVQEYLEEFGYRIVARRFRFAHAGRRWEIDLLGAGPLAALAVECKLWTNRRAIGSKIAAEVRTHLERVRAFVESNSAAKLGMKGRVIPLVVGWFPETGRLVEGVPYVPLFKLNSFLMELDPLDDDLAGFDL